MNYQSLNEQLTGRCKESRKLANNTYAKRRGDKIAIMYYATDVVTYYPDGRIKLDSGGWMTVSTKERLNQFSPFHVWQNKGVWYVSKNPGWNVIQSVPYKDGMTWDGEWLGAGSKDSEKESKDLIKKIDKYVKGYIKALEDGKVPTPSSGDCWGCCMKTEDGKEPFDNGHYHSHIEENYYVPHLAFNALEHYNASDYIKGCIYRHMQGGEKVWGMDIALDILKRTMKRFLKLKLQIAQ
jgi:hypothetical protein